jgi:hypothetical protein
MDIGPEKDKPGTSGGMVVFSSDSDLRRVVEICSTSNAYIAVITMGHLAGNGQLFVRGEETGEYRSFGVLTLDLMRQIVRHPRFYRDTAQNNRWRMRPPI